MPTIFRIIIYAVCCLPLLTGCKKFLEVQPPINTVTTPEMFADYKQAEWAVAGIYSKMIHGLENSTIGDAAKRSFSAGLSTILGGVSSDELLSTGPDTEGFYFAGVNHLRLNALSGTQLLWNTGFKTVYDCNAVLEGLASKAAGNIPDSIRRQLTGEVLTLRAFSYFYLVNFYGELPLALTSDFNQTGKLSRSPVSRIYDQIRQDLLTAIPALSADYSPGKGERVRVNKWFAEALLARVYLYTKEYGSAIQHANAVINQSALFSIEPDLNKVFLKNNPEAIFQLKPSNEDANLRNSTPEGKVFCMIGAPPSVSGFNVAVTPELMDAFGANDKRKASWIVPHGTFYTVHKYKVGTYNSVLRGAQTEYYTVMRLAEMYLIRAEATVLSLPGDKNKAIDDLNVLRRRAGIGELDYSITAASVVDAVAQERRRELFVEWGHRWFDLKRTGKASEVLSQLPRKQPWRGDYQLLYPIPPDEIRFNGFLQQNPEYNSN